MTLEDSIHSQRLRVLRDAEHLGNVSEACRRHGVSRTVFYRWRERLEQYGPDGVHPKRRQARRGRPPAVPVQTERRVIAFALAWPTCGPQWYSDQLAREGLTMAPVTIWRILRRRGLRTRRARLAVLEQYSATTAGLAALRVHAVRSVLLQALPQPIEQRPRHAMPAARFTDIAEAFGIAQYTQPLNVYAVLEGHWLTPFHVSPPRETRGRIGQLALVSSLPTDDSMCQH